MKLLEVGQKWGFGAPTSAALTRQREMRGFLSLPAKSLNRACTIGARKVGAFFLRGFDQEITTDQALATIRSAMNANSTRSQTFGDLASGLSPRFGQSLAMATS